MKTREFISRHLQAGCSIAIFALGLVSAPPMRADVVELSFPGTYDTVGSTVFGLSGPAVPYHYQITYDTALNTSPLSFAAGATMGAYTTTHEWHGYSASGITEASLTFGTKTWTTADLVSRNPVPELGPADFWFDTDLSVAVPTRCWMVFKQDGDELNIGWAEVGSGYESMSPRSVLLDSVPVFHSAYSIDLSIQSIPEPAPLALLALGGLSLSWRIRPHASRKLRKTDEI